MFLQINTTLHYTAQIQHTLIYGVIISNRLKYHTTEGAQHLLRPLRSYCVVPLVTRNLILKTTALVDEIETYFVEYDQHSS